MASSSSFWPQPEMPAMPRISPPQAVKDTSFSSLDAVVAIHDGQIRDLQAHLAWSLGSGRSMFSVTAWPTIMSVRDWGLASRGGDGADVLALAQNGHPVGDGHDLVELVGDDDDGFAVGLHVAQDIKEPVGLLGGEDGGGLVQNQDVRAPVEDLDDLHRLLFRDGHVVDLLVGVDVGSRTCRRWP